LKFVLGIFEISSEDNDSQQAAYEELGLGGCVGLPSWGRKYSSISTMKDQPECSLGWGSLGWRNSISRFYSHQFLAHLLKKAVLR
jgi:hypothetical protein